MDQAGIAFEGVPDTAARREVGTFSHGLLLPWLVVLGACGWSCSASTGHMTASPDAGQDGMVVPAGDAASTGIVVTTPSGMVATESLDGYCDILEAVAAANTDQAVHECPAGHGEDHIVLTAAATYPTRKTIRLSTAMTIGTGDAGGGAATIVAASGFVADAGDRWSNCLVYASLDDGVGRMADVALTQDPAVAASGLCVTLGSFEFRRGRVTGFRQGGIVGTCTPAFGCDQNNDSSQSTTIKVLGSLVDGNRSSGNGGGISSEGVGMTLAVVHSSIVNNVSELAGGGAYFGGGWGTQQIAQSTISGNSAASGGGVSVNFAACTATYLYVLNSTIADNSAAAIGGGIEFKANADCYAQDVTVLASIVNNNKSTTTLESNINADWSGGQFNCDRGSLMYVAPGKPVPPPASGTPCRFDVADALLGPLMPMGGSGNLPLHPLLRGSPAIDAAPDDLAEDQQRDSWIALVDPPAPPLWTVFDRVVDGDGDGTAVRDVGAYEANDVWQTELLAVAEKGSAAHAVVMAPDGYSRGAGTSYAAATASAQFVTYVLPIAEAGQYAVSVGVRRAANAGQFQVALAENASGPWTNLGAVQDLFADSSSAAPDTAFAELPLASTQSFPTTGARFFRFMVTGKAAASAGYQLFLDYIKVARVP